MWSGLTTMTLGLSTISCRRMGGPEVEIQSQYRIRNTAIEPGVDVRTNISSNKLTSCGESCFRQEFYLDGASALCYHLTPHLANNGQM